ncbi:TspO/MBR family protein [Kocuria sp. UCD-OTCP]|uniref:TspO/MBR family protein n=1 Tax=Kocuria sp. UCD-OTCP TaxID=1292021 RepID=UPI000421AF4E
MFWTNLLKTSAQTGAAAAAGTAASAGVDSPWYRDLRKPGLQPPAAVFPVVWTVLYADLAVTSAAVLTELQRPTRPGAHRRGADRQHRRSRAPGGAGTARARRRPAPLRRLVRLRHGPERPHPPAQLLSGSGRPGPAQRAETVIAPWR